MSQKITFADVLRGADALYGQDVLRGAQQAIYEWDKLSRLDFHVDEMPILRSMGAFTPTSAVHLDRPNHATHITMQDSKSADDIFPPRHRAIDQHTGLPKFPGDALTKPTNPKDAVGSNKPPLSCVPMGVMFEIGAALLEGSCKYGRHNWRVAGVRSSVYFDAAMRHLARWWEGEDIDPDSGLSHITKCIAGLVVLRDAQKNGMVGFDDRPPRASSCWYGLAEDHTRDILDKYPAESRVAPNTQTKE